MARKKLSKEELQIKQEKTLETMRETRKKDSMFLRIIMEDKLKWAKAELEKGKNLINTYLENIENYKKKIEETRDAVLKLQGAIVVLNQLLNAETKTEEKKEE